MDDIERCSEREISTAEPPAPPRNADFPDCSVRALSRKPRFLLRAGFIFLVFLIPTLVGSYILSLRAPSVVLRVFIWVIPLCVLFLLSCGVSVWWLKRRIRWEHYLYVNGIASAATIVSESRKKHKVHWKFSATSDMEHGGTSSRINNAVGDRFWVLFDPSKPSRAIRWTRFAENGELIPIDHLQNTQDPNRWSPWELAVLLAWF